MVSLCPSPMPSQASYKEIPTVGGQPAFRPPEERRALEKSARVSENARRLSCASPRSCDFMRPVSICVLFPAGCGDLSWSCRAADTAQAAPAPARSGGSPEACGPSKPFAGDGRGKELSQRAALLTKPGPSLPAALLRRTSDGCHILVSELYLFKWHINLFKSKIKICAHRPLCLLCVCGERAFPFLLPVPFPEWPGAQGEPTFAPSARRLEGAGNTQSKEVGVQGPCGGLVPIHR